MMRATLAAIAGIVAGVQLERARRHRMLCRLIREQDEASMERF